MPLNPTLYSRLCTVFGSVKTANPGVEGCAQQVRRPGGRVDLRLDYWGESYKVCCPFCREERYRLSINWRYGQPDPTTSGRFPLNYLCKCHRRGCVPADTANRTELAQRILGFQNARARLNTTPRITLQRRTARPALHEAPPPGRLIALADLPLDHHAVAYLMRRRFGTDTIQNFGLSYCVRSEPQYSLAQDRIICPIDFNDKRVGWQARYVGTPTSRGIPKYYTSPGMAKNQLLYNFDRARHEQFLVVTEGITDVWRFGDAAVAILGHDLSPEQKRLIVSFSNRQRPVFLMLDATEQDRIGRFVSELRGLGVPAVPVTLPGELDPGDCDRVSLFRIVEQQALQAGFQLNLEHLSP